MNVKHAQTTRRRLAAGLPVLALCVVLLGGGCAKRLTPDQAHTLLVDIDAAMVVLDLALQNAEVYFSLVQVQPDVLKTWEKDVKPAAKAALDTLADLKIAVQAGTAADVDTRVKAAITVASKAGLRIALLIGQRTAH